jgi:cardiolipin synthase
MEQLVKTEPGNQDLTYLNLNSGSYLTKNNKVTTFRNGEEKYESLIKDIAEAKKFVHIEYFIIKNDTIGRLLQKELIKKAAAGVEVKLLYDKWASRGFFKNAFTALIKSGGKVAVQHNIQQINHHNHRKIVVIDGQIGYIGGNNIGDEYMNLDPNIGNWKDVHLKLQGDSVDQLELRFQMDWCYATNDKETEGPFYYPPKDIAGNTYMQLVSSGPDTDWPYIKYAHLKMITNAKKRIYIETPYFIPDLSILEALKVAALSGKDVTVIIPANPDHAFVYWASLSYIGELLEAGARAYEYSSGFLHSKIILADDEVVSIGTANMDIRSFMLNFETTSIIYDKKIADDMLADIRLDMGCSREITLQNYRRRNNWVKIRETVSRLISPVL